MAIHCSKIDLYFKGFPHNASLQAFHQPVQAQQWFQMPMPWLQLSSIQFVCMRKFYPYFCAVQSPKDHALSHHRSNSADVGLTKQCRLPGIFRRYLVRANIHR